MKATVFFDGGVRGGNPGPYGCAVVLYTDGGIGRQETRYLGDHGTSNMAEYEGLLLALRIARAFGVSHLKIRTDSRLVVEQVLGNWKVKQPHLKPFVSEARALAQQFANVQIKHVPREDNAVADALVTSLLDAATNRPRGTRRDLSFAS